MTGGANPRRKGTRWESAVRDYLRDQGFNAERVPAGIQQDRGDLVGVYAGKKPLCIEAKNTNRYDLAGWVEEAETEAANCVDGTIGVVIAKRHRKPDPAEGYVIMSLASFMELLR